MDTSEKYILMCIKAQEVQENKNFQTYCNDDFVTVNLSENNKGYCEEIKNKLIIGDFGSIINNHFYGRVANNALGTQFKDLFDIVIWLPRQDQLQEIYLVNLLPIDFIGININISIFTKRCLEEKLKFNSYEQLWLAFVMKEKYNKVWNEQKEEWVLDN
jgi:hypothetical protein